MSAAMPHFIKKRSAEFTNARHAGLPSVAFVIAGAKIPEAPIRSVALEQEIQPLVATALMDLTAATVRCRIMDPDENPAVAICTANGYDLSEDIACTGWARSDAGAPERFRRVEEIARSRCHGFWRTGFPPSVNAAAEKEDVSNDMARGFAMATLMFGLSASVSHPQPAERITLVIFNQVTEAVHVNVEEARCLDGTKALDGRIVLIERPRTAASFRIVTEGDCAANPVVRLHIALTDLAGGNIGTIALDGSAENMRLSAESTKRSFVCTQVDRSGPASAPVFTARFQLCES